MRPASVKEALTVMGPIGGIAVIKKGCPLKFLPGVTAFVLTLNWGTKLPFKSGARVSELLGGIVE